MGKPEGARMRMWMWLWWSATVLAGTGTAWSATTYPTPPLPIAPMPSASQLRFQQREMVLFFHFGMNTFTDSEWGDGRADPATFDPARLDARQWMRAAKLAGFELVMLTVKHHDGFCLWPTRYSDYSVRRSPWRNGAGDVFRDFVTAARDAELDVGVYLSPWDRHEETYGDTVAYNEHYMAQLRELLTGYGPIAEVWLDGAKGEDAKNMSYMYTEWHALIHQLQPGANIFSDAGPDIRWVGNEWGEAGPTCWSMINASALHIGQSGDVLGYLNSGDPRGTDWLPAECDVSIRPGWFWHANESPWPVETLLDIYYKSTGRNCVLLLNVPPNSSGLVAAEDLRTLIEFRSALDDIFAVSRAAAAVQVLASSTRGGPARSSPFSPSHVLDDDPSTYWAADEGHSSAFLSLEFEDQIQFNVLKLQEAVAFGQRVSKYSVLVWAEGNNDRAEGGWDAVCHGTTIGYKKLDRFRVSQTRRVRVVFEEARGPPIIASVGLYLDSWSREALIRPGQNLSSGTFQ
ncbi:alpha-L-fucosidase [Marchantia polymorpha subsp. ruderalis]|uniref:alpha-L-fucosidase n=2 Tax=Marchantia polymorpha TaxID=3197 RepID=A0AAF6AZI4_MARPO|nr:hypothetical protein MARPO_0037s0106 [Marchantia polymorpha]BBN05168.1 hypothetical protein Mp_3g10900 [Marchantia polymorpha subsp. ruderalis]|eukprot:PTQ40936.1 hypothetical protein MARPO_0037s0106 [Marchantia polymorpha]